MANISAQMVGDLKKKTGAGLMDCKKALVEANGDVDAAIKILREKGVSAAAKKADRIAAEGLVDIMKVGNTTAMVEVNSETDFVARNAKFVDFVKGILSTIIANKPSTMAELLALNYNGTDLTVEATLKDMIYTIGENITLRRFTTIEGTTSTYIHGAGSIGAVVKFEADDAVVANPEFAEFAKNIALQLGAYSTPYLNRESVPESAIAAEKEIIEAQIKNDPKNASKPAQVIEKMVVGKLGKFYEANCLTDQAYVKDDSMKVSQYVSETAKKLGGDIKLVAMERFERGEGIQKKEDNLDEEVAKLLAK